MAYAAVASLKFDVGYMLVEGGPSFRPPCLRLLESTLKEIKSFEEFLDGLGGNSRKRMSASLRRIAEAIRAFQGVIVAHLGQAQPKAEKWRSSISLEVESIQEEFHVIFDMMKKIKAERSDGDADFGGNKPKMVGLSDVYDRFKRDVVAADVEGLFFLIVGMAGVGKTNFAERFFEDLDVLEEFEVRVWVSAGKNCRPKEIPRRILAQLTPEADVTKKLPKGDGYIRMSLKKILQRKIWLIVLDDVWDAGVCGHLRSFLPNYVDGCKVILTSRSRRIVEKAKFVTEIRLLNEKESWVLLREKVFGEKSCPPELEKIGKKIAEKCDGLPLTIITIADLISKIPESRWIDVATQRKHQIFIDAYQEISKVLYPSYEDIPQQIISGESKKKKKTYLNK